MDTLRQFIHEAISASDDYLTKEATRQEIQDEVLHLIDSGEIRDQDTLAAFLDDVESTETNLAVMTLRSVPFPVWKRLAMQR